MHCGRAPTALLPLCAAVIPPAVVECAKHVVHGLQEGEADISTFARPAICRAKPSTANAGPLRYQRRFSGGALWRSLLPNRHSGAPTVCMPVIRKV